MRCTTGSTTRSSGNATVHDVPQALSHARRKLGAKPTLFATETADTIDDITSDVRKMATKLR